VVIGGCGGGNGGRFAEAEAEAEAAAAPGTPEADEAACADPSLADAASARAPRGGAPVPADAPPASDAIVGAFGVLAAPSGTPCAAGSGGALAPLPVSGAD